MPIYDYLCKKCGEKTDIWAKISQTVYCPDCGQEMTRLLGASQIQPDIEPRWEENIAHPEQAPHGSYVTSRQHRDQLCKEYGIHITK